MVLSPEPLSPLTRYHAKVEDLGPFNGSMLRYAGELDLKNRYSSSVMVTTGDPMAGAECTGVLIGPRLALTAGSCVCRASPVAAASKSGRLIDGSTCVARAYVMTVVYGQVHDGHTADMAVRAYAGGVRPHPELRVVLDDRSSVVTSRADLAVILLEAPVESEAAPVVLADKEVTADEFLVTAGYGHDEKVEQAPGERYFRRGKVVQPPASGHERFSYAPQGVDVHGNHGGWPWFLEDGSGRWLVGISSKASGEELTCVSTYSYREWLRAELQRAAKPGAGRE